MTNILVLNFFPAFAPASNGGESRVLNIYRNLSYNNNIVLLSSSEYNGQTEEILHTPTFKEIRIAKDPKFASFYQELSNYSSGGDISAPAIYEQGKFFCSFHSKYLEHYDESDIIIHDSPFTVSYDIFAGIDKKHRIYNAYNVETILYKQLHPSRKSLKIHKLVEEAEKKVLAISSMIAGCSRDDLEILKNMSGRNDVETIYIPNGCNLRSEYSKDPGEKGVSAIFMGSGHPPNVNAANYIVTQIAPKCPSVQFHIVGTCMPQKSFDNVISYGFLDENKLTDVICNSNLALNPMEEGSGSNVKVLNYWAHKIPVVSTSFGMRGIECKETSYIRSSLKDFAETIISSIKNPALLFKTKEDAYQELIKNYTWQNIAEKFNKSINKLVNKDSTSLESTILFLNDYNSLKSIGGGCVRTQALVRSCSKVFDNILFLCYGNDDNEIKTTLDNITIISLPKTEEHLKKLAEINNQFWVSSDDIVSSIFCIEEINLGRSYEVLASASNCIICEHPYMTPLPIKYRHKFIYSSQNVEYTLKSESLEFHPVKDILLRTVKSLELNALKKCSLLITCTDEDAECFSRLLNYQPANICILNGAKDPAIPVEFADKIKLKVFDDYQYNVCFIGSGHGPNLSAGKFILDKLVIENPNINFHFIGSICNALDSNLKNCKFWGIVNDAIKATIFANCELALNPVFEGGGSNIKTADYLIHGLPVLVTPFGQRGYDNVSKKYLITSSLDAFNDNLKLFVSGQNSIKKLTKKGIHNDVYTSVSMDCHARNLPKAIKNLDKPKLNILFVTYRYTNPALGGAEAYLEKLLRYLDKSNSFNIDVVATKISDITTHNRYHEDYTFNEESARFTNMQNVRSMYFELDKPIQRLSKQRLQKIWTSQILFDKTIAENLEGKMKNNGLLSGFIFDKSSSNLCWVLQTSTLYLKETSVLQISGHAKNNSCLTFTQAKKTIQEVNIEGDFNISVVVNQGLLTIESSIRYEPVVSKNNIEARPLAFYAYEIKVDSCILNSQNLLVPNIISELSAKEKIKLFALTSQCTHSMLNTSLTDVRGPYSSTMNSFLKNNVPNYDLVITHNYVFKPAKDAIENAKKYKIPSLIIPHAHLDDDYYHFADLYGQIKDASCVIASPQSAVNHLINYNTNTLYGCPGIDTEETFSEDDSTSFYNIYSSTCPYILVLGRKSGAKNYTQVIDAVNILRDQGKNINLVMIGPDDDKKEINKPFVYYLGRVNRGVVKGALANAIGLCNMSGSESFGIVILEAWLGKCPVLANKHCDSFCDLIEHNINGKLVDSFTLAGEISSLYDKPDERQMLIKNGLKSVQNFSWNTIGLDFVKLCHTLANK
ncbi:glycosyltransferase [Synechococcus sp. A10-1-5-9]|uniref:glycosyltransferase n=1 Tax=Synechococcus sp. A10-1-5-9 TaxID=3392295 RepID=UPI0039E772F5